MKDLKHITNFVFNYAQYDVTDDKGSHALLKINYKDNDYSVDFVNDKQDPDLKNEASNIAQDLLSRKHGVNFANI
jgi:hypothetical protein